MRCITTYLPQIVILRYFRNDTKYILSLVSDIHFGLIQSGFGSDGVKLMQKG